MSQRYSAVVNSPRPGFSHQPDFEVPSTTAESDDDIHLSLKRLKQRS